MARPFILTVGICFIAVARALAQQCDVDLQFIIGAGANGSVESVVLQPWDNRILIGGRFDTFNGAPRKGIARLHSDGSLDSSFNPGTGTTGGSGDVYEVALQPDGRIIIGGDFTNYNGVPQRNLARLHSDGSLDTDFTVGNGPNGDVVSVRLQPDGKILLGGAFNAYNGISRYHVARVDENGALDAAFNSSGSGTNGTVFAIALDSLGRILIGGSFTTYNGTTRENLVCVDGSGIIDESFNSAGIGPNHRIRSIIVEPDSSILVAGYFTEYNGAPRSRIARLYPNGALDESFNPGTGAENEIRSMARSTDMILIAGFFQQFDGQNCRRFAMLNHDGGVDLTCNTSVGSNQPLLDVTLDNNGMALLVGSLSSFNTVQRNGIVRLGQGPEDLNENPPTSGALELLPNPTDGKSFRLEMSGLQRGRQKLEVNVISSVGQSMHIEVLRAGGTGLSAFIQPTHRLLPGLYLVRVSADNRPLAIKTLVVAE